MINRLETEIYIFNEKFRSFHFQAWYLLKCQPSPRSQLVPDIIVHMCIYARCAIFYKLNWTAVSSRTLRLLKIKPLIAFSRCLIRSVAFSFFFVVVFFSWFLYQACTCSRSRVTTPLLKYRAILIDRAPLIHYNFQLLINLWHTLKRVAIKLFLVNVKSNIVLLTCCWCHCLYL